MAENIESGATTGTSRRPSAALLLSGLAALLVALWALVGPDRLGALGDWQFTWVLVLAAVVVGVVLVIAPGRRK
ncbi:hypothetical protein ACFWPA_05085 [Rhodococcus sp. NPDC058505]|uniref:hypothetical protein n=1 Tax=unclassified Rhodococcus (in: high G+C Gram-positive bacteria) TaxID=192944 RepID=UPI0036617EED